MLASVSRPYLEPGGPPRIITTRKVLMTTVTGEINLSIVNRLRAAVAAGFDDRNDGDIVFIDLTEVTFGLARVTGPGWGH